MNKKETNHNDMEHDHGKMDDMKENENMHKHEMVEHSNYTCPMHPEVIQDHSGKCPKCGMFLEPIGGTGDDD